MYKWPDILLNVLTIDPGLPCAPVPGVPDPKMLERIRILSLISGPYGNVVVITQGGLKYKTCNGPIVKV
jgi:hypothetical protein